jgi:hypothetical protein
VGGGRDAWGAGEVGMVPVMGILPGEGEFECSVIMYSLAGKPARKNDLKSAPALDNEVGWCPIKARSWAGNWGVRESTGVNLRTILTGALLG